MCCSVQCSCIWRVSILCQCSRYCLYSFVRSVVRALSLSRLACIRCVCLSECEKCGTESATRCTAKFKSETRSKRMTKRSECSNSNSRHQNILTITFTINNTQSNYKLIACGVFAKHREEMIKPGIGNEYITALPRWFSLTRSVGRLFGASFAWRCAHCKRKLPDESFRYCSCSRFHQVMHIRTQSERQRALATGFGSWAFIM